LLLAAAPIAVFMNSVRIAVAGILLQYFGVEWLDGFTHFFEGWVIFMSSVVILFGLAWVMLQLNPRKMSLSEALDLDTDALLPQIARLRLVRPSRALITAAMLMIGLVAVWPFIPERSATAPERSSFAVFPQQFGEWRQFGAERQLTPEVAEILGADDYHTVQFSRSPTAPAIDFFAAWYRDLSLDGVQHTPEICLPAAGWEIAKVERVDIADDLGQPGSFKINRVIIQKDEERMMVYYWFTHMGQVIPTNAGTKFSVLTKGAMAGRLDGAIVRLIRPIGEDQSQAEVEAEMNGLLKEILPELPRFVPGA
jgi:exosortase D (VPLPA-CTERM-specific)